MVDIVRRVPPKSTATLFPPIQEQVSSNKCMRYRIDASKHSLCESRQIRPRAGIVNIRQMDLQDIPREFLSPKLVDKCFEVHLGQLCQP